MKESNYPLVTLRILFYNHEKFVSDAVAGALAQSYPNLEIILSDDCSSDNTYQSIKDAVKDYTGPHKLIVNRNEKNLGLVPHINKIMSMSHGEIFCGNGGDDISLPNRVSDTVKCFMENPQLKAITMSYDIINQNGEKIGEHYLNNDELYHLTDKSYLTKTNMMWGTTALAIRREVWDVFGPLSADCQTEDSTTRFRCILLGPVMSTSMVGLKRRVHDSNMSKNIYSLKTEPIANQYMKDLTLIKDRLSSCLYDILEKKVSFYIKYRNFQAKICENNIFIRKLLNLQLMVYSLKYRFRISNVIKQLNNQRNAE